MHRAIYRSIWRSLVQFEEAAIPLTGVAHSPIRLQAATPRAQLQQEFRTPTRASLDDALVVVRRLQAQLQTFASAEDDTREALAAWQGLLRRHAAPCGPLATLAAIEEGAFLVHRLAQPPASSLFVEDQEEQQLELQDDISYATSTLDQLAAEVLQMAPSGLFPATSIEAACSTANTAEASSASSSSGGSASWAGSRPAPTPHSSVLPLEQRCQQVQVMNRVLYEYHRYRQEPYEWVYDNLLPALLPEVLRSQRGMSYSLALTYCCLARRLGVPVTPLPAGEQGRGEQGGKVPRAIQARQVAAAAATAPSANPVLLRIDGTVNGHGQTEAVFIDPLKKGLIMMRDECFDLFPSVSQQAEGGVAAAVAMWAEAARVLVTAHQRRGEGDRVAYWLFQLLALDPSTPEWADML